MYKSLLATYTHQSTFMNQRKWIEEKNKERVWSQTRRHGRFTKTHTQTHRASWIDRNSFQLVRRRCCQEPWICRGNSDAISSGKGHAGRNSRWGEETCSHELFPPSVFSLFTDILVYSRYYRRAGGREHMCSSHSSSFFSKIGPILFSLPILKTIFTIVYKIFQVVEYHGRM